MKHSTHSKIMALITLILGVIALIVLVKHRSAQKAPEPAPTQTWTVVLTQTPTPRALESQFISPTPSPTLTPSTFVSTMSPAPTQTLTSSPIPTSSPTPQLQVDPELLIGVNLLVDPSTVHYWTPTYNQNQYLTKYTEHNSYNINLLAKLLCCEAGGNTSWQMQVWTLSAILNNLDIEKISLDVAAHDATRYSVANWVDDAKPTSLNYRAIEYVLNGHRIADICYFRTRYYHPFGVPYCDVEGQHYFSTKG